MKKLLELKNRVITCLVLIVLALVLGHGADLTTAASVLYVLAWILAGYDVVIEAIEDLREGEGMAEEFLMTIATIGALALKAPFEAATVMTLYQLGELLQDAAIDKSQDSLSALMDLKATTAHLYLEDQGQSQDVDPETVQVGDLLEVRAGEKIPVDGLIVQGQSSLDTSALTGESMPVAVQAGDKILSGSINGQGRLLLKAGRAAEDSSAARLVRLVKEAEENKAETESLVHRFAKVYTPIVTALALVVIFLLPLILEGHLSAEWVRRGLNFLIVACPCAFAISVPVAFVSGMGAGSRLGFIVKGGAAMEKLTQVKALGLDKTGTLTEGNFSIRALHPEPGVDPDDLLLLAARAEQGSTHPIADAFRRFLQEKELDPPQAFPSIQEVAGRGLIASEDGATYLVGNRQLLLDQGAGQDLAEDGCEDMAASIVYIAQVQPQVRYWGHIVISDQLKAGAAEDLQALKDFGIEKIAMLTGDGRQAALQVGTNLGLNEVHYKLLPEDKLAWVQAQQKEEPTAFVGDGLNDAPVLAAADVGVVMGMRGSDAAIQASDLVLMNDDLASLVDACYLSRKTVGIAKQNIVLSIVVKLLVMVLSLLGRADMLLAVVGDVGVTLLAVANGLRVFSFRSHKA